MCVCVCVSVYPKEPKLYSSVTTVGERETEAAVPLDPELYYFMCERIEREKREEREREE